MFYELDDGLVEDEDAVVPAPIGPRTLGPFRRLNLQFGGTYVATHDRIGARVMIQVVKPLKQRDRERVIRGIKAVQQYRWLSYIQKLIWITQQEDDLYLVTEMPDDTLLSAVMRLGPLDPASTARVFTQILVAVATLHADLVVHGHLTLRTVLLCGGVAKLSGFDYINEFNDETLEAKLSHSLSYCSPEVVAGVDVTMYDRTKMDMWALGCILFFMATGTLAFEGSSRQDTIASILKEDPHVPAGLVVDPDCEACIRALLDKDPSKRPSAMQLLRSDWLCAQYEATMAEHSMRVLPAVLDAEMYTFGFPQDHVAASRVDSEYSLPSAERVLVEARLRESSDERVIALVPGVDTSGESGYSDENGGTHDTQKTLMVSRDTECFVEALDGPCSVDDDAVVPTIDDAAPVHSDAHHQSPPHRFHHNHYECHHRRSSDACVFDSVDNAHSAASFKISSTRSGHDSPQRWCTSWSQT